MGDIADGLINGDFDFHTGEYLGPGMGFPRTGDRSLDWEKPRNPHFKEKILGVKDNQLFGILNFIVNKTPVVNKSGLPNKEWALSILTTYSTTVLNLPVETPVTEMANITQNNFGHFIKWFTTINKNKNSNVNTPFKKSNPKGKGNQSEDHAERW